MAPMYDMYIMVDTAFCLHMCMIYIYIGTLYHYIYHGHPEPTFSGFFMVTNLVFRWPKPLSFMVLGSQGIYIYVHVRGYPNYPGSFIKYPGSFIISISW